MTLGTYNDKENGLLGHITVTQAKVRGNKNNRKNRREKTYAYFLPKPGTPNNKVRVCKKMFLSTVSVSERVTRTALEKVQDEGTLEEELRGGRRTEDKDAVARAKMREHIN